MSAMVAVLYARSNSIYKSIHGCEVFDIARDARSYSGGMPVIAHPPCRLWGRLSHFSSAEESEKELAYHAIECVRRDGGILEHPAYSRLWAAGGLPLPESGGRDRFGGFTVPALQSWWGHKAPKATWFYFCGIAPRDLPSMPFAIGIPEGRVERLSRSAREGTPKDLAHWLINVAQKIGGEG